MFDPSQLFEAALFKYAPSLPGGACPAPRKCEDLRELSAWFHQFGAACRAALPKEPAGS